MLIDSLLVNVWYTISVIEIVCGFSGQFHIVKNANNSIETKVVIDQVHNIDFFHLSILLINYIVQNQTGLKKFPQFSKIAVDNLPNYRKNDRSVPLSQGYFSEFLEFSKTFGILCKCRKAPDENRIASGLSNIGLRYCATQEIR